MIYDEYEDYRRSKKLCVIHQYIYPVKYSKSRNLHEYIMLFLNKTLKIGNTLLKKDL